jgi:thiol-disulfide isomerase/thioredoxin
MKPVVIGGAVVVALVAVFVVMGNGNGDKALMEQKAVEEKMVAEEKMKAETMMKDEEMKKDEAMKKDGEIMKDDQSAMKDAEVMSKGSYGVYNQEKLAMANDGKVVLFFKASWCPSCRALDADIKANLGSIPAGVAILEVDYDSSADLKKKYGVTMQHTLVQVDANGELIKKWSGGATLATVAANIK